MLVRLTFRKLPVVLEWGICTGKNQVLFLLTSNSLLGDCVLYPYGDRNPVALGGRTSYSIAELDRAFAVDPLRSIRRKGFFF